MAAEPTHADSAADASDDEARILEEMEQARGMKISELKMKLMAKGVLASTFVEKNEMLRAYAEAVVKESKTGGGLSGFGGLTAPPNDGGDNDDDENLDDEEELPPSVKPRVERLKTLHQQREVIMKEYLAERAALEAKYEQLSEPLYAERKTVVAGGMDEDIAQAAAEGEGGSSDANDEGVTGIPHFWARAIHQMPVTAGMITPNDLECLQSLVDVRCIHHASGEGFTLEFEFAPNDFFENTVLTKQYEVPNLLLADEPILKEVQGCEIRWKDGKSLTHQTVTKQQRGTGKNAGQTRTVTKTIRRESFFGFFTAPSIPTSLEAATEEDVLAMEAAFEEDYDVAQAVRSHIVPKAVLWFAGAEDAMEDEMEAAMEGLQIE